MESFGARLKRLRETRQLKQRELGQRAGMDSAQVSRYERGVIREPSSEVLARLARALDTDVSVLRGEHEERRKPELAPLRAAVQKIEGHDGLLLPVFVRGVVSLADRLIAKTRPRS